MSRSSHQRKSRPTVTDVAKEAGVSAMTVSRVVLKPDRVSAKTRERVRQAMADLGYTPNRLAYSLRSSTTSIVAAIVPTISGSIIADTVQGIADGLRTAGYQLLLGSSAYDPTDEAALLDAMASWRPAGMILAPAAGVGPKVRALGATGMPVVEIWEISGAPVDMAVGFSNFDAAYAMTRHLHGQGYRRIAFVRSSRAPDHGVLNRVKGYAAAVEDLGLAEGLSFALDHAPFSVSDGTKIFRWLLATHPDVDAIFFVNDILAIGALFEAHRMGVDVPGSIAIAGFGDYDSADSTVPRLTTVRVPRHEIGFRASQLLVRRLAGEPIESTVVDVGFEIMSRESA